MEKAIGPKKLQQQGDFEEARQYYIKRYLECLREKDGFLSSLYLDEVAQCLIAVSNEVADKMSPERLKHQLSHAIKVDTLKGSAAEQADLDIHIELRKRFPESFQPSDSDELE